MIASSPSSPANTMASPIARATSKLWARIFQPTIHHFKDHIHFAHFRDLHGQVPTFSESFHDDGDTDMAEAIRAYKAIGFKGVVRPDHTPTFAIDEEDTGGYNFLGRLYAVGYMRGLIHGTE